MLNRRFIHNLETKKRSCGYNKILLYMNKNLLKHAQVKTKYAKYTQICSLFLQIKLFLFYNFAFFKATKLRLLIKNMQYSCKTKYLHFFYLQCY